jgi:hypothetical protein
MTIAPRVVYDKEYSDGLSRRNEEKLRVAKENLGVKWLLHPDNKISKVKFKGQ